MWNRKSEPTPPRHSNGNTAATAVQNPTAPTQQNVPATGPQAPVPFKAPEPVSRGTAIGAGVSIIGEVYSEEDLFIDGEVNGKLELKDGKLTIGPKGKAKSNVKAREVIIHGKVQGDVDATQKITIKKDGSLVGNIKTTGIVIDDDAYFKGSIDIVRKEG